MRARWRDSSRQLGRVDRSETSALLHPLHHLLFNPVHLFIALRSRRPFLSARPVAAFYSHRWSEVPTWYSTTSWRCFPDISAWSPSFQQDSRLHEKFSTSTTTIVEAPQRTAFVADGGSLQGQRARGSRLMGENQLSHSEHSGMQLDQMRRDGIWILPT
jgi:hypothetical protein